MFETIHHFQQLSSCVGSNSCGVYFNAAPNDGGGLYFGATHLQGGYIPGGTVAVPQTEYLGANSWLADSNSTVDYNMATSDQGMFSEGVTVNAFWSDTTAMDNLRGADITSSTVAGSLETIGANTTANNVRGGHSIHTSSSETTGDCAYNADGTQPTGGRGCA